MDAWVKRRRQVFVAAMHVAVGAVCVHILLPQWHQQLVANCEAEQRMIAPLKTPGRPAANLHSLSLLSTHSGGPWAQIGEGIRRRRHWHTLAPTSHGAADSYQSRRADRQLLGTGSNCTWDVAEAGADKYCKGSFGKSKDSAQFGRDRIPIISAELRKHGRRNSRVWSNVLGQGEREMCMCCQRSFLYIFAIYSWKQRVQTQVFRDPCTHLANNDASPHTKTYPGSNSFTNQETYQDACSNPHTHVHCQGERAVRPLHLIG